MDKIITEKRKMTQVWKEEEVVPVTVLKIDDKSSLDHLEEGEVIDVSGISKGKGFQGSIKRHGFSKGPKTHGQKHTLRATGSIGDVDPQRVMPGKKMPGRTGNERVTVKNLEVVEIHKDDNEVYIKGAVPGHSGSEVEIRKKNK